MEDPYGNGFLENPWAFDGLSRTSGAGRVPFFRRFPLITTAKQSEAMRFTAGNCHFPGDGGKAFWRTTLLLEIHL